jgi:hypothetical protein
VWNCWLLCLSYRCRQLELTGISRRSNQIPGPSFLGTGKGKQEWRNAAFLAPRVPCPCRGGAPAASDGAAIGACGIRARWSAAAVGDFRAAASGDGWWGREHWFCSPRRAKCQSDKDGCHREVAEQPIPAEHARDRSAGGFDCFLISRVSILASGGPSYYSSQDLPCLHCAAHRVMGFSSLPDLQWDD